MTNETRTELEMMIDKNGLSDVLDAISVICAEKAEHLRTNWQDKNAARDWTKASNLVDVTTNRVLDLF